MVGRPHVPVMLPEVIDALSPTDGGVYVDGTFGAGGYTTGILSTVNCNVVGIDRDPTAIDAGQKLVDEFDGRLSLVQNCFGNVADCVEGQIDGFVLDIGCVHQCSLIRQIVVFRLCVMDRWTCVWVRVRVWPN